MATARCRSSLRHALPFCRFGIQPVNMTGARAGVSLQSSDVRHPTEKWSARVRSSVARRRYDGNRNVETGPALRRMQPQAHYLALEDGPMSPAARFGSRVVEVSK